ncbi:hypothetical protein CDV36_005794 [Fusarium kuroshium]|uniref:Extracellular membrane protein CFEM domain-containing protein n=2 Tax=Fusarium solani species complex TaxID=232080 RepID=A0A3M2SAF3_9HYPO|nr:hypothetical protein CDV36_005794 [Fusarium kuroshium]RSM20601.1 hypothetical protein CDV31_000578 [Fusarium ambrosium]
MAGQSTRRWLQLSFILMVGSAAANSLTLSDFESISSPNAPVNCVQAYDTPLAQCTPGDFTGGKACSAACKDSVRQTEAVIQQTCSGVSSDEESLLYRGQRGELVAVLCRDMDEPQTENPEPEPEPVSTPAPAPAPAPPTTTSTSVASTLATRPKENILIETHASTAEETTKEEKLTGPGASVGEDLATKSSLLAVDTEEPTISLPPAPTALRTSAAVPTQSTETSVEEPSATPTAAGSIHVPSLGYMCVSFAMSTLFYMMAFN